MRFNVHALGLQARCASVAAYLRALLAHLYKHPFVNWDALSQRRSSITRMPFATLSHTLADWRADHTPSG